LAGSVLPSFFFSIVRRSPRSTLFPYTTLFRSLLILDELSYLSFTRNQAELLFHVLSERNERGSVIITTNLEFSRWTEIFPDTMLTAALVDRLTHRAHILDMNVPSYRLEQRLKQQRGGESQG